MSTERNNFVRNISLLFTVTVIATSQATEIDAQSDRKSIENEDKIEITLPRLHNMRDIDSNNDGLIDIDGLSVQSGETIFRPYDGVTRVEEGRYVVPNNAFYIDEDGDGNIDSNPRYARIVVVMRDNLTYLFEPNSQNVMGVFPNGVGSSGSNSVASIRRINVRLGREWGENYSKNAGYEQNMFGSVTLGTRYVIDADPNNDIDTFQEIHGTPTNLEFLLGEDISGGCVRHSEEAIRIISAHVEINDFVLTVETPEDDIIDNSQNLYDKTRYAAGLAPINNNEVSNPILYTRSEHVAEIDFNNIEQPTWIPMYGDQINDLPIAEHPFTRGDYHTIPCGTEAFYISEFGNLRERLVNDNGLYSLIVANEILLPSGERIPVSDFYNRTRITSDEIRDNRTNFSGGDERIAIFQYLVWDYAYQYAEYVAKRDSQIVYADQESLDLAVFNLSPKQLREIQLVTGLLPVRYSLVNNRSFGIPGDRFAAGKSRTLEHSLMNIFHGEPGEVYELDYRHDLDNQAYLLDDMQLDNPSFDHEFVRESNRGIDFVEIIDTAVNDKKSVIFRITGYRYLTENISYYSGLSANHYYALMPQYTDISNGYIGIQDSLHPYEILIVPIEQISSVFSTVTISP